MICHVLNQPINVKCCSSSHLCVGVRECVVQESACMACKRSPVRSRYSPPKSTVLRRKYGAFLFAEAGFWGLHCFACTVFRLLQAVPIQPPMVFHKFGTISASLPSTLPVPSKGRFDGCAGKKGDFPHQPPQRAREPPQNG